MTTMAHKIRQVITNSTGKSTTCTTHFRWETCGTNQMIDDSFDSQVIQPSRTAWSQVHLVRKPTNEWRFTADFRNLNKVIFNKGWQIPKMKEMIERIGILWPARFAIAIDIRILSNAFGRTLPLIHGVHHISWYLWMDPRTYGPSTLSTFLPTVTLRPKKHGRTRTQRSHIKHIVWGVHWLYPSSGMASIPGPSICL